MFNIRNSTIKAGLLNPHHLETAEKEQAFYNDLDFYSRNYKRPGLLPNGHFIGGDSQLEFKLQRCFAKEDDWLRARLNEFSGDQRLKNLMTILFQKADLNGLGFSSTDGAASENKRLAVERLLRLKPFVLRLFMPVTIDADGYQKGVSFPSSVKSVSVVLEALHLNLASSENFRHLQHGSEAFLGSPVLKILRSDLSRQQQLDQLQCSDLTRPHMQTLKPKLFNAIVAQYINSSKKDTLVKLVKDLEEKKRWPVKRMLEQKAFKALEIDLDRIKAEPGLKGEDSEPDSYGEEMKEAGPVLRDIHQLFLSFRGLVEKKLFH